MCRYKVESLLDNAPNYLPSWVRYPKDIYTCRYAPGCETKSSDAKDEPLLQVDTKTSLTCMIPGLKGEVFSFCLKSAVCFDIFFLGNVY